MTRAAPIDEHGRELRLSNVDPDGQAIDVRMNTRAGIVGAILLLEQIARYDLTPKFRREARVQVDVLKALIRSRKNGHDFTDAEILGDLPKLVEQRRKALPAPGASEVVDV